MHTAQTEAFDRLYALEFKRFIAGKMVRFSGDLTGSRADVLTPSLDQAKARLELFPAQHERGDLGEVFCKSAFPRRFGCFANPACPGVANPRLPDQPASVSAG